ncbi:MAG: four helix bundle protein [Anaerolineae bacterium]|nr:four helix bundle protein [Anaerolineae bacterium]
MSLVMNYNSWEQGLHQRVKSEPVWDFFAYRKALFFYDLVWKDSDKLNKDSRGKAIVQQLIRSAGSISANIEEGYGRGFGKEYAYYLRISLGSARETKGWYWRAHHLLPDEVIDHRLALIDEIISLLITEINRQKKQSKK